MVIIDNDNSNNNKKYNNLINEENDIHNDIDINHHHDDNNVSPLIMVTGGTGYIGSHCCVELLQTGYRIVIIDNLCNSSEKVLQVIEKVSGKRIDGFHKVDLCDELALREVFSNYSNIKAVIHFAGLKAVGESTARPLEYYRNNLIGSLNLFNVMQRSGIKELIYSSSATVYGDPSFIPIDETCPTNPTSPYGRTKVQIEQMIMDLSAAGILKCIILRYFNPAGAHPSGELGENPLGIPNNLMPYLAKVAIGKLPYLTIYGSNYPTRDGTGVRDYIHITDLCTGHVAALRRLAANTGDTNTEIYNLGSGIGHTVLEMVQAFSNTIGRAIPFQLGDQRPGDVATLLANPSKANKKLNWHTSKTLNDICIDLWKWQSTHPAGWSL